MHVSEQPAEVETSLAAHGLRPAELVAKEGLLDERFTAVHASHLVASEIAAFGRARANICACPTTERDLGDGILAARELLDAGASICIGSDSQTVIDPWEEIRSVEYHARLARLRRVLLDEPGRDGRREIADLLLRTGSSNGAKALGLEGGRIAAGLAADLVAIDLEHPALAGWTSEALPATITLCGPASMVSDVWVAGARRIQNGLHELMPYAQQDFHAICRKIL
jgi:formimidoylglutamate deiminase